MIDSLATAFLEHEWFYKDFKETAQGWRRIGMENEETV